MPTHWESSKRPLFVRTVFVNGNRHAILSQEDPLCQSNAVPSSRKQSRPSSCQSFASTFSINSLGSQESNLGKRFRNVKNENAWEQETTKINQVGKGDISSELQGCLVKLRLVLATHENKNKCKNERLFNGSQNEKKGNSNNRQKENVKQKRKKSNHSKTNKKKSCDYYYHVDSRSGVLKESDLKDYKEENNNYFTYNNENDRDYYYLETTSKLSSSTLNCCCEKDASLIEIRDICCFEGYHEARKENETVLTRSTNNSSFVEKVERNPGNPPSQFFPTIQLPSNDISWNSLSSDSYFTRPFYNPLSERVLQWLDLASKRRESAGKVEKLTEEISSDTVERIFEGSTFLDENNIARYRDKTKSKKNKMLRSKSEGKTCQKVHYERKERKREMMRQSTEKRSESKDSDAEDEVRQENDIETALSNQVMPRDYPKFSRELNKLHKSKSEQEESSTTSSEAEKLSKTEKSSDSTSSGIVADKIDSESSSSSSVIIIPQKPRDESTVSLNLQESIMNSFNEVVSLKPNKENENEENQNQASPTNYSFTTYQYFPQAKVKTYQTTVERRGLLTRQSKLQESSDEDEDSLKARKIESWNKNAINVKQRRNAFSHRNSMFNKTIDCNNARNRREIMKRQKNLSPSLQQQKDKNDENSSHLDSQSIIQAIFHQNSLPPHLQNKIPWLRDYQTGGKNMWPSDKGTNKPQLHIFMPAIPPKISEGGTGEESISECESLTSEVCPCSTEYPVPDEI